MDSDVPYDLIASALIKEAVASIDAKKLQLFSRHVYELVDLPDKIVDQVNISAKVFSAIIKQYGDISENLSALMVIDIEDSVKLDYCDIEDLCEGKYELGMPAEIYFVNRIKNDMKPYVVEEYKRPIQQNLINASSGSIYSYFRSFKNKPGEFFARGFYFEHYPLPMIENEWR
jgi:hypothetical protein